MAGVLSWWRRVRGTRGPTAACASCGHARDAHEHYRSGSDCALCGCPAYRRGGGGAG